MNAVRIAVLVAALSAACGQDRRAVPASAPQFAAEAAPADELAKFRGVEGKAGRRDAPAPGASSEGGGLMKRRRAANGAAKEEEDQVLGAVGSGGGTGMGYGSANVAGIGHGVAAVPTRAWFPQAFLFEPEVGTDVEGRAEVVVRVPDRLTTWRVLALGHTADGHYGGAVAEFLGTLPVYVELSPPPDLQQDDVVELPVLVVNTSAEALTRKLRVDVDGATIDGPRERTVTVPARSQHVERIRLTASRPGRVELRASLDGQDAVAQAVEVAPRGRPVSREVQGTLGATRHLTLELPPGARPESSRFELQLAPGPLEFLRTELESAERGSPPPAYALALVATSTRLAGRLALELDPQAQDDTVRRALQGALRESRAPTLTTAIALLEGVVQHPGQPVLRRLAERLVSVVVTAQRPDGTFGGETGWPLQRLLVQSADARRALALAERAGLGTTRTRFAALKATQGIERLAARVDDPYTAAAILASGPLDAPIEAALAATLDGSVKATVTGSLEVAIPEDVLRADGVHATPAEALALAALATERRANAAAPELARAAAFATEALLALSTRGGDSRVRGLALAALEPLLAQPLPDRVNLAWRVRAGSNSAPLGEASFSPRARREALRLDAPVPTAPGPYLVEVETTTPLPGLGFVLRLVSRVPWTVVEPRGFGANAVYPRDLQVGLTRPMTLRCTVPVGVEATVSLDLPAGVTADVDALQARGAVQSASATGQTLELTLAPRDTPGAIELSVPVTASLAGRVSSGPLRVEARGETLVLPPSTWTIAAGR